MSAPAPHAAPAPRPVRRRRLAHLMAGWPLRRRLVVAVIAIVALVGIVVGAVSVLFLRSYLVERLDTQLSFAVQRGVGDADGGGGRHPDGPPGSGAPQGPGTLTALVVDGRVQSAVVLGFTGSTQTVSADTAALARVPDGGRPVSIDLGGDLGRYRLAARDLGSGGELVVGLPYTEVDAVSERLAIILGLLTLAAMLLALVLAAIIVRLSLAGLDRVAATASRVATLPLDRGEVALAVRVPERDTDSRTEVGRVGFALNRMLVHVAAALAARQASENRVRRFVADASHELRTPLASIRGYAELSRRGPVPLTPEVARSVGRIESEATRMTAIVEDLLLLARLDEGRELARDDVDLVPLVVDAVSDAHAAGPDHRWGLELPDEPAVVTGDGARLAQVVVNLLANARVHTPAGTAVTASVRLERPDAAGGGRPGGAAGAATASIAAGAVVLEVADDGPGIDPSVADSLFERFARGDSSRSRETGSTGLGLAIVSAVVEAHHGTVGVESSPGRTVFRVVLPTAAVLAPAAIPEPAGA